MNSEKLKKIEELLLKERDKTAKSITLLQPPGAQWLRADDVEVEGAQQIEDGEGDSEMLHQSAVIAGRELDYLDGIELALERLRRDPESFGYCLSCGKEIPFARLMVVPHTRYCIDCKGGPEAPS